MKFFQDSLSKSKNSQNRLAQVRIRELPYLGKNHIYLKLIQVN
jgi:hypothetical protein